MSNSLTLEGKRSWSTVARMPSRSHSTAVDRRRGCAFGHHPAQYLAHVQRKQSAGAYEPPARRGSAVRELLNSVGAGLPNAIGPVADRRRPAADWRGTWACLVSVAASAADARMQRTAASRVLGSGWRVRRGWPAEAAKPH